MEVSVSTFTTSAAGTLNTNIDSSVMTLGRVSAPDVCSTQTYTNTVAAITLSDQASNFVTSLLPPQGFSLVNLDLGQLNALQEETGQQQEDKTGEVEELEDGVNLVVKATYWWCKDCDIKQKFGSGESMEDHLHNKHKINNRVKEGGQEVANSSVTTGCKTEPSKEGSASDLITSVYTIPSNSVTDQDQAVDTLIIFDDSTTLQVIAKPSEDKLVDSDQSELPVKKSGENSQASSTPAGVLGTACCTSSVKSTCALPQPKLIPVIPALPSNYSVLKSAHTPVKTDIATSSVLPVLQSRANNSNRISQSASTLLQRCHEEDISVQADVKATQTDISSPSMNSTSGSLRRENQVESKIQGHRDTSKKASTEHNDCSVRVKRLTAEEILQIQNAQKCPTEKSNEKKLSKETRRATSQVSQALARVQTAVSASKRLNKSPAPHLPSKKARHSFSNTPADSENEARSCNSKQKLHSSFGRKIKKPARYVTGSESEEDGAECRPSDGRLSAGRVTISEGDRTNLKTFSKRVEKQNITVTQLQQKKQTKDTSESSEESAVDQKKSKEGRYSCQDCGRKFRFENKLKKHMELYSGQAMRQCSLCGVKLHNQDLLNTHLYHVHNTKESTSCNTCGKLLGSKRKLLHHLLTHPSSKGQTVANLIKDSCTIHQCKLCSEAIVEGEGRVEKHYLMHKKTTVYPCQKCGKTFKRKLELYSHLKTHGIIEEHASVSSNDHHHSVQENTDCSKNEDGVLLNGDYTQKEQEKTSCSQTTLLMNYAKHDQTRNKSEDSDQGTQDACVQNSSIGESTNKQHPTISAADSFNTVKNRTETVEKQGEELQPVEKIIAQSVQQILKYEENGLASSNIPITDFAFISSEVEEAGAGNIERVDTTQRTQPSFYCQLCNKHFPTKKLLYQHLKNHGKEGAGTTGEVDTAVFEEDGAAHQPVDLSGGVPFGIPCSMVKVEGLEGMHDYLMRSFTTTPEGLVVPRQMHYTCALCEREFQTENKARRHINRFSKQRSILQCNVCPRKFHNLDLFNVHYAYVHQREGATTCMTCALEFSNKGDFLTHLGNSPTAHPLSLRLGLKTFLQDACGTVSCSVCQKSMWNYPLNVANHMKLHKSFTCPVCQQGFPYKYALLIHLQVHSNSKNLATANELSQTGLQRGEQEEQVSSIHSIVAAVESPDFVENSEKFTCSICRAEVWCHRKNIHRHLDLHARRVLHAVREGRYFCPDCGEDIVVTDQNMYDHLASHGHSTVQFMCVFCTQVFSSFDEYKDHEVKKHWLNMYFEKSMCEVCGKEVANRQELKKHVQLHKETQGLFSCSRCHQTFRFEVSVELLHSM